jgi:hypothetical protein
MRQGELMLFMFKEQERTVGPLSLVCVIPRKGYSVLAVVNRLGKFSKPWLRS